MKAAPTPAAGRALAAVALLIFVWLAATAWMRTLTLPDEGRYAGVAWEMLRSGDWLTPTLDGLPFFHKPPLFYWLGAASMAVLGVHEWAARLPSLLGASAGAFALWCFVRRWAGPRLAMASLLVLLTQPLYFVGAQFANLDMLVAGCITVTVVLFAHAALGAEAGAPAPRLLAGGYAAAALGVLAKGLIGALLPALVIAGWALATRRPRRLRTLWSGPGLLLFLLIVLPWFVAMQQRHAEFLHYFIVVQHVQRFAAGGFNNVQPFWFFPAVLLLLGLPWTPWLAAPRRQAPAGRADPAGLRWLMLSWLVVVVGFFSLPQSKLIGYVLPAVPPLAVLIADAAFGAGVPSLRRRRLWRASAAAAALLCLGTVVALALAPLPSSQPLAKVLRERRGPGEPVRFLGGYFYDLPLYARLERPVPVGEDWADPAIAQRDNWRKELADAARFAADGGRGVLVGADGIAAGGCRHTVTWVLATQAAAVQHRLDEQATRIATRGDAGLWRQPASALNEPACRGTPSGD